MRFILPACFCILLSIGALAQSSLHQSDQRLEIRIPAPNGYNQLTQQQLRDQPYWKGFVETHDTWYVHFNEVTALPHRAYGKPVAVAGNSSEEKAQNFITQHLADFSLPSAQLVQQPVVHSSKFDFIHYHQFHEGFRVLGADLLVKLDAHGVVQFGCEVHRQITVNTTPTLTSAAAQQLATEGLDGTLESVELIPDLSILPRWSADGYTFHLVYTLRVHTRYADEVPAIWLTYVDAHSGDIWMRKNLVAHAHDEQGDPIRENHPPLLQVTTTVNGTVYPFNPFDATVVEGLANIYITSGGIDYPSDLEGNATLPVSPGSSATIALEGPWAKINNNGVTPTMTVNLADGQNTISFDNNSSINDRCAYRAVQQIHDFHKFWMPDFSGMDFQLPTNVDVTGTCNAFYDGSSINFYAIGGGCNASSLVADICHHEYGHGINDNFYSSIGGFFQNGAIGEAYADFWAISLNNNPVLGTGFNTDNLDPIRRYDVDPKVYPSDLVGEVHSDGEILMGAWWDTHLLMGADWNITMPLFVEAYYGLQAATFDGNEGEAFTDVLIDLLQADDDDGDITNGTPNGNAIVEGFYLHGITLISNATLTFVDIPFLNTQQPLNLDVYHDLNFPYTQYLSEVSCFYQVNNGTWQETPMTTDGSGSYVYDIPGQPAGTVISYYFGAHDINGSVSGVIPIGAHLNPFPNLPYFTLVGVQEIGSHDSDNNADFGQWQTGVTGDNNTTGTWEEDAPVGSFTTDVALGTMVQVDNQHTPGGEFCFITGNANVGDGIGANDVDGGKTTLQTPTINMSNLADPIVAYWRYYTNNPPGGANPGLDYWQVRISNDAGATWTYVENTRTADMSWRRNAFHVADYVTPTAQMRLQFIASDSLFVGTNLDGGSLIEAAVDDFVLYDKLIIGVDDQELVQAGFHVFPNPSNGQLAVRNATASTFIGAVDVLDAMGRIVWSAQQQSIPAGGSLPLDLSTLADGRYMVRFMNALVHVAYPVQLQK